MCVGRKKFRLGSDSVGFSDSLFFIVANADESARARAHLSPIQSMAFGAENNEAMRRDMKFSVTPAIRESLVDSISETLEIIDSDYT